MDERKLQERNRTNVTRRRFSAGLCLGLVSALTGCGGSTESLISSATSASPTGSAPGAAAAAFGAPRASAWDVVPTHVLTLQPGESFDLAATLPPTVVPGGVFEVDASGSPLPAGITLVPTGLITVTSSANGSVAGVVFRYTPPA